MIQKIKDALSATHIALVLLGMLVTAAIAYGKSVTQLDGHERRITTLEMIGREDIKALREEMNHRFDRIEDVSTRRAR